MRAEDFDVNRLIEYLQGTCKSLQEGVNDLYSKMDEDDLTEEDSEAIDAEIFNCETCGWWCESCDQDEDGNCTDCSEEEE